MQGGDLPHLHSVEAELVERAHHEHGREQPASDEPDDIIGADSHVAADEVAATE
jgi:hypothetical protein